MPSYCHLENIHPQNYVGHNACLRLEPHMTVQEGLLELDGRRESDWAGGSATRQFVTGYHCTVQGVPIRNRSLKQTVISLSSCEAQILRNQYLRGRISGSRRTLQRTSLQRFSSLEMDSDSARHVSREEDQEDSSTFTMHVFTTQDLRNVCRLDV